MRNRVTKGSLLVVSGALALAVLALAWAAGPGSAVVEQGTMHNCPQPGRWGISVWEGADATDAGQALAKCGAGMVYAAYYLDPQTGAWLRWFGTRPELNSLHTLNNMQGVLALGGIGAPATPSPSPAATLMPTLTPTATGAVVFRGRVVDGPTKTTPFWGPCGWWWWIVHVEIAEVVKMEQGESLCAFYDYVPGETIEVVYFANDVPDVAVDDYVEVSGEESMFSCGCQCCCDRCGFMVKPETTGHYIRRP
jgi:hypothetical protein